MTGKYVTETLLADDAGIDRAVATLRDGGLVAVPTETVYGLAARADSEAAVARIYQAKGRPGFNPLIVHVRDVAEARRHARFNRTAEALATEHWPGPLTLVLPRQDDSALAPAVTAGLPTVAVRCPAHPVMRALLAKCAFPLAAPSANRSGFISPTNARHVAASLDGRIEMILDGGPCVGGIESTIVAVREDGQLESLRPGPIDLGQNSSGASIEAPGQLASHYAPGKPMRLNAAEVARDEFLIGFGPVVGDCTLSTRGDCVEAAANLYACLHEAARSPMPRIAVATVPDEGVGRAINDRLRRAATLA